MHFANCRLTSPCLSQLEMLREFLTVQSTLPTQSGSVRLSWQSICTFSLLMIVLLLKKLGDVMESWLNERQKHSDSLLTIRRCKQPDLCRRFLYVFELKSTAVLGGASTLSNTSFFKFSMPFFIVSSPVYNRFKICASRPHAVGSVCTRDPSIVSIHNLHFRMDRVATDDFLAHLSRDEHRSELQVCPFVLFMWLTLFDCATAATLPIVTRQSLFATFQSHISIWSIKSASELQCHSFNVRANHALSVCLSLAICLSVYV